VRMNKEREEQNKKKVRFILLTKSVKWVFQKVRGTGSRNPQNLHIPNSPSKKKKCYTQEMKRQHLKFFSSLFFFVKLMFHWVAKE